MTTITRDKVSLPYAPYRSWKNLIDKLRTKRPLPEPFDSGFWNGLGFSGGLLSVLKPTMVSLGLLDKDNRPQPLLDELLDNNDANIKTVYTKLLEAGFPNYSDKLDTERMTGGQITQYLSDFGAAGDTGAKARTFFLGLVKDAGLPLSPHVSTRTRTSNGSTATRKKKAPADPSVTLQNPPGAPRPAKERQNSGSQTAVVLDSGGTVTLTLNVDLFQLSSLDRDFVLGLVDHVKQYLDKKNEEDKAPIGGS